MSPSRPLPYPPAAGRPTGNLYSSQAFLEAVASTYHPGRFCLVQDHQVDGQVFRLLCVAGRGPQLRQPFLDLHEPLGPVTALDAHLPTLRRLPEVARAPLPLEDARQHPLGAPTIVWDELADWPAYLQRLRQRRVLSEDQRRGRRLVELRGELGFQVDDLGADVMPRCLDWKNERDRSLGREPLLALPQHQRFFAELRARGLLRASTLRAGGELMAVWLGAVHRGRWSGWIFAFNPDPALARCSPGRQLLYPMLEASYRAGHREFDFSIGMEAYKLHFATHVRPIARLGSAPWVERLRQTLSPWVPARSHWAQPARAALAWCRGAAPAQRVQQPEGTP